MFVACILSGGIIYMFCDSDTRKPQNMKEIEYGLFENRRVVKTIDNTGNIKIIVRDSKNRDLFFVPLQFGQVDSRFKNGKLRFIDNSTGREGYIDSCGYVALIGSDIKKSSLLSNSIETNQSVGAEVSPRNNETVEIRFDDTDIKSMSENHPFSIEAKKILSGKLDVSDSESRRQILNYCEHFRTAYTTKDLDFLRQVFSDNALIIVGHCVKYADRNSSVVSDSERVKYSIRSKQAYLKRLTEIFKSNKTIDVSFSDFKILRHPTMVGIYGVSLRQKYKSERYSDDGYLFLLWDFRNSSMPLIHVRTWQPNEFVSQGEDLIGIGDFNLE